MDTIKCAATLAKQLHKGQVCLNGADYYKGHLSKVANLCCEDLAKICAYLHDAASFTQYSEAEIVEMLNLKIAEKDAEPLSARDVEVLLLTLKKFNPRNYSSREEYINAFKGDARASFIKKTELSADIKMLRSMIATPDITELLAQYEQEYGIVNGFYNDPKAVIL